MEARFLRWVSIERGEPREMKNLTWSACLILCLLWSPTAKAQSILIVQEGVLVSCSLSATATWAIGAASNKPTPIEFWHVGDDTLSERLAEQTEVLFMQSPDFTLSSGRKPGTLIVTIPTNVEWKRVDKRDRVRYTVEFSWRDGQKLGVRTGSCWDDKLAECAAHIVRDASVAARKVR